MSTRNFQVIAAQMRETLLMLSEAAKDSNDEDLLAEVNARMIYQNRHFDDNGDPLKPGRVARDGSTQTREIARANAWNNAKRGPDSLKSKNKSKK